MNERWSIELGAGRVCLGFLHAGFPHARACQRTPCPATPESLGVVCGADVQFSVPMVEDDGDYAASKNESMKWGKLRTSIIKSQK